MERRKVQVYYIKVGENKLGPFQTKAAAASEAKALKDKGFDVSVVQRTESESALFEALGNPEAEIEIETDDEFDFDAVFGDEDDAEGDDDGDDGDDGDEGDEGDDSDDDGDDDSESEGDDEDEQPSGVHGWFKSWGGN